MHGMSETSSAIDLGADEGRVSFKIGDVERTVDVYKTQNHFASIWTEVSGQPVNVLHDKVKEYMVTLGFPEPSNHVADLFYSKIAQLASDLQKKTDAALGLPNTTASTPGTGQTENS